MRPIFSTPGRLLTALGIVLPLAAVGLGGDGRSWPEPCPRSPQRAFQAGSVIEIGDEEPLCRIEFRDTGIRLDAVADGSRPDPGPTIVADPDGLFMSANAPGWATVISVWDARGRYLYSFGGEGEGPGEFSPRGALNLLPDDRGRLHVRDGSPGWSVFSPTSRVHPAGSGEHDGGVAGRDGHPRRGIGSWLATAFCRIGCTTFG